MSPSGSVSTAVSCVPTRGVDEIGELPEIVLVGHPHRHRQGRIRRRLTVGVGLHRHFVHRVSVGVGRILVVRRLLEAEPARIIDHQGVGFGIGPPRDQDKEVQRILAEVHGVSERQRL